MKAIYLLTFLCIIASPAGRAQGGSYDFSDLNRLLKDSLSVSGGLNRGYGLILIRDGEVIYDSAFGSNYSTTRVVPIASASKWLSGATIMSLVDEGLISLDQTVGEWFPDAPVEKKGITIRQLFSLTAGFPAEGEYHTDRKLTLASAVDSILQNEELLAPPGTAFIYGGASMQVAGRIAELATGKSWDSIFAERIARPLGLVETNYDGLGMTDNPQVAGGAQSSAREYATFLQMIVRGGLASDGTRVLSEDAVATMLSDQTGNAFIGYSPYTKYAYIDSLLPNARYGIGLWREVASFDTASSPDLTSPGAFGFGPWIDPDRNIIGVFSVLNLLEITAPTYFEVKKLTIRAIEQQTISVETERPGPRLLNLE